MGEVTTVEDLKREASNKEVAYNDRKKAKLEKPNPTTDRGEASMHENLFRFGASQSIEATSSCANSASL